MDKTRLEYLINVCKSEKATLAEREELESWYSEFDNNPDVTDSLDKNRQEAIRSRIWQQLTKNSELGSLFYRPSKQIKFFQTFLFKAAAMVTIVVGFGLYFYTQRDLNHHLYTAAATDAIDIQPGGSNATLTLADGSVVDLKAVEEGKVIAQDGLSIVKTEDGTITYQTDSIKLKGNSELSYNTISTPRGGEYKVILPDGTLVWLNASSSLTYPTQFDDSERLILLSGEAYFEVSHQYSQRDKKRVPFKVKTSNQEIEVLGTHFNVKAYEDEQETATTLLEGKVRVIGFDNGTQTNEERILKIGETAFWDSNTFEVQKAVTEKVMAWRNGKFIFSGENIREIMKDVSRWYDVDVAYKGDLRNVNFEGSLSRYENISEILRKLELTGTVSFKIIPGNGDKNEGRRIEVMK